ncbi:MAG: NADP-dependent malic enzyme [Treponema sp.]|jgi:malate dehydrogenase (oxaloacetate-decarboxylating)|nr:NADP-dependent malic enzyme [Treponema sp.]
MYIDPSLENLDDLFPEEFTDEQRARAKTVFFKALALDAHRFYGGKLQTAPKCGIPSLRWLSIWYTPGVSAVSTAIREDNNASFALTNRGNLVAVVSDSTRVLGDGDCTPAGGLGVMEGKAMLMKFLGGMDATPLCVNTRGPDGKSDPRKLIDFVTMIQPSFGAINLEDISQPNCFTVLDALQDVCDIPVWHDDAQGTACIMLAGLINALSLAEKTVAQAKIVLLGAGAANTAVAKLIMADGGLPENIILFDVNGALHNGRADLRDDPGAYRQWELCQKTNPEQFSSIEDALIGADVLIALSAPGPDTVKPAWIRLMAERPIVFACANPTPENWPSVAKEAGAFIVATGRGDFPNQLNNALCFPGILKGALMVRARKISDGMAIRCAHSIAEYSQKAPQFGPERIIAGMDEVELFAREAADVAVEAVKEKLSRVTLTWQVAYKRALADINAAQTLADDFKELGYIQEPPQEMLEKALLTAISSIVERR